EAGRSDRLLLIGRCALAGNRLLPGFRAFSLKEPACKSDTGPTAHAGQNGDILLAVMLEGVDVTDNAGWGLELVKFLAIQIDGLDVAFKCSVEDHVARGRQGTGPYRELFRYRPDDFTLGGVEGYEVAHAAMAVRCRIHRNRSADIGLTSGVADPIRLVVHADMVGRHVEELGLG